MSEDKQRYYVSVSGRSVIADATATSYEFIVEATDAERDQLIELMNESADAEEDGFVDNIMFVTNESNESINNPYKQSLSHVYQYIYGIGTPETKQFLQKEIVHVRNS
ncbi:hypothetical protein [Paenibacillus sp. 481]|uniref:hypothetical protein n=1 Tax=Paenibacillus sp. 481 TaxID=2835869 RepID=UPI001E4992BB|nr:hypothetical protein [Paenibacillus sp. 481]UHA74393.1 hypothetical protein KIK04_04585 [Paenibacillus sp. 481]